MVQIKVYVVRFTTTPLPSAIVYTVLGILSFASPMAEAAPAITAVLSAANVAGKAVKKLRERKAAKQASLAAICENLHRMIAAMNEARPHYNEQDTEMAEAAMRL